jgi:hypothetical protein
MAQDKLPQGNEGYASSARASQGPAPPAPIPAAAGRVVYTGQLSGGTALPTPRHARSVHRGSVRRRRDGRQRRRQDVRCPQRSLQAARERRNSRPAPPSSAIWYSARPAATHGRPRPTRPAAARRTGPSSRMRPTAGEPEPAAAQKGGCPGEGSDRTRPGGRYPAARRNRGCPNRSKSGPAKRGRLLHREASALPMAVWCVLGGSHTSVDQTGERSAKRRIALSASVLSAGAPALRVEADLAEALSSAGGEAAKERVY